jgi:hypothetical protein
MIARRHAPGSTAGVVVALVIPISRPERTRLFLRRLPIWFTYLHYQAPTTQQRLERTRLRRLASAAPASCRGPAPDRLWPLSSPGAPSDLESEPR